jgi:hypothetical protein
MSVLDHLGRNLYRSFATVLGEAISNSWDANARNVWIYIDKSKNSFFIKDDGDGMTADDFQNKFLKIGYSKRKKGENISTLGRPYIGRKGIGKLALLSCADKITVISKIKKMNYVGGCVNNSGLDRAITEDLEPSDYPLEEPNFDIFDPYTKDHESGTVIYFEGIKEGIKNNLEFLRKIIALYFRFSLLDKSFNIFLDGTKITLDDIKDLAQKTEFLWNINNLDDPYIKEKLIALKEKKNIEIAVDVKGFIASVTKPRDLKIYTTDERIGVDLFVNGRLREKDILKYIPKARLAENYLYGQIHFNSLDDETDRFTTGREGIVANDKKFKDFLEIFSKKIGDILQDWDIWRIKHREDGDSENARIPLKERKAGELYNVISKEYECPENAETNKKIGEWIENLATDAQYNFSSYADCFISENLIRNHIKEKNILISGDASEVIQKWRTKESENKTKGNVSINIRQDNNDLSYLDMDPLTKLVDPQRGYANGLTNDAKQYKPIRDALMHTALLTNEAKQRLTTVYENIKGRVKSLLSGK